MLQGHKDAEVTKSLRIVRVRTYAGRENKGLKRDKRG